MPSYKESWIGANPSRRVWCGSPSARVPCLFRLLLNRQFDRGAGGRNVHSLCRRLTVFAPGLERVLSRGDVLDFEVAVFVRHRKVGRWNNNDIARHFRVHIAKQGSHTKVVELERLLIALRPRAEVVRQLLVAADGWPVDVVA